MAERIRTLPDAELAVMQAVWACEAPAKRAQLAAILDKTHPMAPTTLLTVLSRLADKGFDPHMGARPLRRLLRNEVEDKLAHELLFGFLRKGGKAHLTLKEDELVLAEQ